MGVDAAADAFRLVAVEESCATVAIEIPIVPGEVGRVEAACRAFHAAERKGISGVRECVAIAPTASMVTAVLELPPRSSGAPIESLAAAELMRGRDGAGLEVALFPIREQDAGPVEYFAAGANRDEITALAGDIASCGVEVVAVDAPACALGRACQSANAMVIALERESVAFHVVHEHRPLLSRSVSLIDRAAPSKQIVAEVDRCAAYLATYRAESAIDEIVLVGARGDQQQVIETITGEFDVGVRVWRETLQRNGGGDVGPAFAGAYGAATWREARGAAA
ncbi:MAG: hypothetical protein AAFN41_02765 [Planctomycetota bacterium]